MPVGRRSSVCTSHSCSSLRRTVSPAPPSNSTLSGTTTAARPLIFRMRLDVLDEVELLVAGGGPEVVAHDGLRLALGLALFGDEGDAALLAEGRIGQHHVEAVAGVGGQAVGRRGWGCRRRWRRCRAGRGSSRTAGPRCPRSPSRAARRGRRCCHWSRSSGVVCLDVVVRGQQEAAGAAGRVADGLPGRGAHHVHDGLDERPRREVLARAAT